MSHVRCMCGCYPVDVKKHSVVVYTQLVHLNILSDIYIYDSQTDHGASTCRLC